MELLRSVKADDVGLADLCVTRCGERVGGGGHAGGALELGILVVLGR